MLTQARVDGVIELIKKLQRPGFQLSNFDLKYRLIGSGFYPADSHEPDRRIMLASVSKILIAQLLAEALEDAPSSLNYGLKLLMELHGRLPAHFQKLIADKPFIIKLAGFAQNLHRIGKLGLLEKLVVAIGDFVLHNDQMPTLEIFYQAIGLSSNEATRIIQRYQQLRYGSPQKLQAAYEVQAPSFTSTVTLEKGAHWNQYMPNTGQIHEFATLLEWMVINCFTGKPNVYEQALIDIMTNNAQDFKHCATFSEWGQELIAKGVQIIEKTGYYPAVTWIPDLNLPCHMTISTVFTLHFPDGRLETFGAYWNLEMPIPTEPKRQWGVVYPNEWGENYRQYAAKVKAHFSHLFRDWLKEQMAVNGLKV